MAITKIPAPAYIEPTGTNDLSPEQRQHMRSWADMMTVPGFMPWEDTAEGWEFWNKLHDRVLAIADGEPTQ